MWAGAFKLSSYKQIIIRRACAARQTPGAKVRSQEGNSPEYRIRGLMHSYMKGGKGARRGSKLRSSYLIMNV